VLIDINLKVLHGSLVVIVGEVGPGKSCVAKYLCRKFGWMIIWKFIDKGNPLLQSGWVRLCKYSTLFATSGRIWELWLVCDWHR